MDTTGVISTTIERPREHDWRQFYDRIMWVGVSVSLIEIKTIFDPNLFNKASFGTSCISIKISDQS